MANTKNRSNKVSLPKWQDKFESLPAHNLDLIKVDIFKHLQTYLAQNHPQCRLDPYATHHYSDTAYQLTITLKPTYY